MIRISVIICTVDRPELLQRCLSALIQQIDGTPHEVIVVEQGTPGTDAAISPCIRWITTTARGLSQARNRGAISAKGDIVAFLDDDAVPLSGYLTALERAFEDSGVAAVAGRIVILGEESNVYARTHTACARSISEASWMTVLGGNIAVRRDVLCALGGFDERFGAGTPWASAEETDLFFRMRRAGYRWRYEPTVVVAHPREPDPDIEPFVIDKLEAYGRGLGAMFAKQYAYTHGIRYYRWYLWSLLKPAIRCLHSMLTGCRAQFRMYAAILRGRIIGYRSYGARKAVAARCVQYLDSLAHAAVSWMGWFAATTRSLFSVVCVRRIVHGNICIVQTGGLGDVVLTLPVVAAARAALPEVRISIIVRRAWMSYVTETISGITVIPDVQPTIVREAISSAHAILFLRGGSRLLVATWGNLRARFVHALPRGSRMRWSPLYHAGIPWPFRSREHQYTTIRRAAAVLGITMPVTPEPINSMTVPMITTPASGASSYAVVHPGGSWSRRWWPPSTVRDVCAALLASGITQVHLIGSADEIALAHDAKELSNVVDHIGKISLGEMTALIAGAAFFAGNDSAPAHIAAGFRIPGVVTYGPQDPALFGTIGGTLVPVGCGTTWCSPCWQTQCVHNYPVCLDALRTGAVALKIRLALGKGIVA